MTTRFGAVGRAKRPAGLRLLTLLTAVALGGCATTPAPQPSADTGRLLIKIDAQPTARAQSLSADFELSGNEQQGSLRLSGPLGTQLALAHWQPGEVTLVTTQETRQFPDLATLSREALGEDVPLGALAYWLKGQPWPGASSQTTATPPGFVQLGWQIDTSRLQADGQLEATRAAPPAVLLRARLDR